MSEKDSDGVTPVRRRADSAQQGKAGKCAICGRPRDPAFSPFCSRRCADVDLSRWISGSYVIPGPSVGSDDE